MGAFGSGRGLAVPFCTCAILAAATGCANASPRLAEPVGETHTTASAAGGARPEGRDTASESVGVVIAEDVRRACELPDQPAEAPRFDFDSARLRPRGEDILAGVATCIISGRLRDATLELVGHTDPRGPSEYNQQLGLYRALAAKRHMESLGVPGSMLTIETRGELDAAGSDESSWALDRRVEIRRFAPRGAR